MQVDREAGERIAELTVQLKHQYQVFLMASGDYGEDARLTREIDHLGCVVKELEDAVAIAVVLSMAQGA